MANIRLFLYVYSKLCIAVCCNEILVQAPRVATILKRAGEK
jgi:hypothetical protein